MTYPRSFLGAIVQVDDNPKFDLIFRALWAEYNNIPQEVGSGKIDIKRGIIGDNMFLDIMLDEAVPVQLEFDCQIAIIRISDTSVQIEIDHDHPFALGVSITSVVLGETEVEFPDGAFAFVRKSGEDPKKVTLKLREPKMRISFSKTLLMGIMSSSHTDLPHHTKVRPISSPASNRIEAYELQTRGLAARLPNDMDSTGLGLWEKIVLTADEAAIVHETNRQKRQRDFEKNCGC